MDVFLPGENHSLIPWSQLTRYCEIYCSWEQQERLASYRQLTNLRVLHLRFPSYETGAFRLSESAPSVFPHLCSASFYFRNGGPTAQEVIQFFDMPALEVFSVHYDVGTLRLILPRSTPRLKILRIHLHEFNSTILTEEAERALEMLSSLTEIAFIGPSLVSNRLVSRLTPYRDRLPLCPNLEIIRLSNRSFVHNDCMWTTLLGMLCARFEPTMEGISRRRKFEFHPDRWAEANDQQVVDALKRLRNEIRWDIRVGDECRMPDWDDMHLSTG
jgi:hypothetical protein